MPAFAKMRPSDGPTNPMLVASVSPGAGAIWSSELTLIDNVISLWAMEPAGEYVVLLNAYNNVCMTVSETVSNGQRITVESYTGADLQLWKAVNQIGVLWTFAPKVAPEFILQTENGALTINTHLTVGLPTPGPGGVGVISSQEWVYPQH